MIGLLILLAAAALILYVALALMMAWEMRHPPRHTTAYALAKGLPCDPSELPAPLPFQEWRLERAEGVSLAVWDIAPQQTAATSSLTAVFVHGWGHSRVDVLPRLNAFVTGCRRMILFDLRGHGESSGTSRLGHSEEDDLVALLEEIQEPRIVLVAHSMGAVIAVHAALKAARTNDVLFEKIAGLILYGPYCEFHTSLQGRLRRAGYPARPITDLALLMHRLCGVNPLNLSDEIMDAIKRPVLIFHGDADEVSPIEHGRRLACSPHIALHEISNGMHTDAHVLCESHDELIEEFLVKVRANAM